MSEHDDLNEILSISVTRAAADALQHIEAGDVEAALIRLREAVIACEAHPAFSKFASSPCNGMSEILAVCLRMASRTGSVGETARELLQRMNTLNRASVH